MGEARKYLDIAFKILLLAIGFSDFFGILPDSLDILDKVLTSAILAYFWFQLKLSSFLFGKRKKWLDYSILVAFYVLVIDSFVQLLRIIDLTSSFAQFLNSIFVPLPFIKSFFLFLYNVQNASLISGFSFFGGFLLLLLIALYAAIKMTYGKKSVMHSFARLFMNEKKWKDFGDTEGASVILKFLLSFLVLISMYQYFFALVNQWFVVSLDKSLLILAIIYAVKDIQGTKSKALNTIGNFDNWLLKSITELFTNYKKFYLGFSVLLVFHMLSDIATFFIPYVFPFIDIDPFYLNFLGDAANNFHQPFGALLQNEVYTSLFSKIIGFLLYHVGALGSLALVIAPLLFLYALISEKKFTLQKKWFSNLLLFSILVSSIFFIAPWFSMQPILTAGIQGVDFTTKSMFSSINIFDVLILSFILGFILFKKRKLQSHLLGFFVLSTVFFSKYIINYFVSSAHYHIQSISFFLSSNNMVGAFLFILLFLLELLFYLGGFMLLTYNLARLLFKQTPRNFLTTKFTYLWTIILLITPLLLMFMWSSTSFIFASAMIFSFVVINYAAYKEFTGKELRDDYLLAVTSVLASYQLILVLRFVLQQLGFFQETAITIVEPILLAIIAIVLAKKFKLSLNINKVSFKNCFLTLLVSLPFVVSFILINEPSAIILPVIGLIMYTFFVSVSEELFFRVLILRIALKTFSKKAAIHLQAFAFTLIHMVGIRFIWQHYVANGSLLFTAPLINIIIYAVLLYVFSLVASWLMLKNRFKQNIVYVILFHWLVNLLVLL